MSLTAMIDSIKGQPDYKRESQLQNYLSFPKAELNVHNASIGNTVFQAVRTRL